MAFSLTTDQKRNWTWNICAVGPTFYYIHKNRSVLLASKQLVKKASFYSAAKSGMLGQGRQNYIHHVKEIIVRFAFGTLFGLLVAEWMYPERQVVPLIEIKDEKDLDLAERLQDKDSIQYAHF